jgi:hypothetical protein
MCRATGSIRRKMKRSGRPSPVTPDFSGAVNASAVVERIEFRAF